jgi:hypothetical protein
MSAGHGTRGESTESPSHAAGGDANGAILAGLLSIVGQLEQDNRALARRVGYLRAQLEHAHHELDQRDLGVKRLSTRGARFSRANGADIQVSAAASADLDDYRNGRVFVRRGHPQYGC